MPARPPRYADGEAGKPKEVRGDFVPYVGDLEVGRLGSKT